MTTTSTQALYTTLRTYLLGFTPLGGATPDRLGELLTDLYVVQAPDNAVYPYGTMRLTARATSGAYNGDRETPDLEIQLYGRPRSQQYAVEGYADVMDQAMRNYADATSGLVFCRSRQRDTLPAGVGPADREVVTVRLVYPLIVWPVFLTQYAGV